MGKVDEPRSTHWQNTLKKRIDEGNDMENEITERQKALAELVSARALMQNPSPVEAFKSCFRSVGSSAGWRIPVCNNTSAINWTEAWVE